MKVEMFRRCFVSLICDSRLLRTKKDFRNFLRSPKINTVEGIQRRRSGFTLHGSICHWRRRPQQKATNMRGRTYGKWFVLQTELFSWETGTALVFSANTAQLTQSRCWSQWSLRSRMVWFKTQQKDKGWYLRTLWGFDYLSFLRHGKIWRGSMGGHFQSNSVFQSILSAHKKNNEQ